MEPAFFGMTSEVDFVFKESAGFILRFVDDRGIAGYLHGFQSGINFDGILFLDSKGIAEFQRVLLVQHGGSFVHSQSNQ